MPVRSARTEEEWWRVSENHHVDITKDRVAAHKESEFLILRVEADLKRGEAEEERLEGGRQLRQQKEVSAKRGCAIVRLNSATATKPAYNVQTAKRARPQCMSDAAKTLDSLP